MRFTLLASIAAALFVAEGAAASASSDPGSPLGPGATAWRDSGRGGLRGVTVGPIESALHPGKGYGSAACARTMGEARALGANWVSITPFGRTLDLGADGSRSDVRGAVHGESPRGDESDSTSACCGPAGAARAASVGGIRRLARRNRSGRRRCLETWARSLPHFLLEWAKVAETAKVDMLAVGVELRSWVTTTHAPLFSDIVHDVRRIYSGLLTYGANWDDVEDTVIWGDLDVIGLNAFFPLSLNDGASFEELRNGGIAIAERVGKIAEAWQKPVIFNEMGYTTRTNTAVKPWTWPEK